MIRNSACRGTRARWMQAFDSGREPDAATRAHLASCAGCTAFVAASERLRCSLQETLLPALSDAATADAALLAACRRAPVGRQVRPLRLVAAAAAGFVLTLALGQALMPGAGGSSAPEPTAPLTAAELDDWVAGVEPVALRPVRRPNLPPRSG